MAGEGKTERWPVTAEKSMTISPFFSSPQSYPRLLILRLVWVILTTISLGVFLFAIPARYAQYLSPEDEIRIGLARQGYAEQYIEQSGSETAAKEAVAPLGLPPEGYAGLFLALEVVVALVYVSVGFVVAWRKFDDPFGLFASLFLIVFGVAGSSYLLLALSVKHEVGFLLGGLVTTLAYSLMPPFFYLFPDGRWVPRWGWIPTAFWAFTTFFWNLAPRSPINPTNWPMWLYALNLLFIWGSAGVAQIYRYRQISSFAQRQQTKWLVAGFGSMVGLTLLPSMLAWIFLPDAVREVVFSVMIPMQVLLFVIIPVTLGISILRYRLWDIDILIRRTLQYTLLTGLLALAYFGGVVVLQAIFSPLTRQTNSPLVTVITTLGIAALFNPLRIRVQNFIDRRFFRQKYNAAQVLVQFAVTARDEVEMEKLAAALQSVVQETMQPDQVGIWLRPPQNSKL